MSAPTPAPGDDRPREGYYPDPSIPGYVRYWNGAAWVPGTSRPAPKDGETPAPPPGVRPAQPSSAAAVASASASVEETGPHFFDEDPVEEPAPAESQHGSRPEPGSAWGADRSRQSGFGGDQDRRVSWGAPQGAQSADPRVPHAGDGPAQPDGASARTDGTASMPPTDSAPGGAASGSTFVFRRPTAASGGGASASGASGTPGGQGGPGGSGGPLADEGTMTFRALSPRAGQQGGVAGARPGDTGASGGADGARTGAGTGASGSGPAASGFGTPGRPGTAASGGGSAPAPASQAGRAASPAGSSSSGFGTPGQGGPAGSAAGPAASGFGAPGQPGAAPAAQAGRTVAAAGSSSAGSGTPGQPGTAASGAGTQPHAGPGGSSGAAERPGFGAGKAAAARAAAAQAGAGAPAATATPTALSGPQQAPAPAVPAQSADPRAAASAAPLTSGPGGGQSSWAQQVHRLAGAGGDEQPVAPWKPPVEDVFQAAARRQASARPAGLGRRLAARLLDTLVLAGVTSVAAVPLGIKAIDHINEKIDAAKLSGQTVTVWLLDGTTSVYLGIVLAVLLLAGVVYEVLPTAKWGRTLGKKLLGLEVRDIEAHEAPEFGAALRRWLVYSVPGLLVVGVVGVLWCLFDKPWRQCWHDKAAHTFVAG
ncbi:hypothetical protein GCM10027074_11640 [Streptomyces deserti]